jgi:hypothetical protein
MVVANPESLRVNHGGVLSVPMTEEGASKNQCRVAEEAAQGAALRAA